jgi:catechol-2,3-dioxygenase
MAAPWTTLELDHVVLRVADQERMLGFYTEVLGCEVAHRQDHIGLVHLRAGGALIDLVWIEGRIGRGVPVDHEKPNLDHICLRVAPWDEAAIRAHLAAHGIAAEPAATRYGHGGSAPSIYLRDPEGNGVELRSA